jgi:hypothetical protein
MKELQPASSFVIQFRKDGDGTHGKFSGQIEHIASGNTAKFRSMDDVPELLRRMLREVQRAEQTRP